MCGVLTWEEETPRDSLDREVLEIGARPEDTFRRAPPSAISSAYLTVAVYVRNIVEFLIQNVIDEILDLSRLYHETQRRIVVLDC